MMVEDVTKYVESSIVGLVILSFDDGGMDWRLDVW